MLKLFQVGEETANDKAFKKSFYLGCAVLGVLVLGSVLVVWGMTRSFSHTFANSQNEADNAGRQTQPIDEVDTTFEAGFDVRALRLEKSQQIDAYRWVDKAHGVAGIPLSRAIEIMSEGTASAPVPESR